MSLIHKETNYDEYLKTFNSFSGCDMVVTCNIPGYDPFVIGSAQTLSYSIHMARNPVRSIGNINAKDYTLGPRTIAGTLIFAVFDKHVIYEMMKKDEQSNSKRIYADYSSFKNSRHMLMDEMPPFDITISYANEYGHQARLAIYGIRLIDEGKVMSINDIYTENTYQYVATDIDYLNDDEFDKLVEFDSFSDIEEDEEDNEVVYAGIDEQDILMLEVFDNINPAEKTIRLRWKYGDKVIPEGTIYIHRKSNYSDVGNGEFRYKTERIVHYFNNTGEYYLVFKSDQLNDKGEPLYTATANCIVNYPINDDLKLTKPIIQYQFTDANGSTNIYIKSPNGAIEYLNTMIPLYHDISYSITDSNNNIIQQGTGSSIIVPKQNDIQYICFTNDNGVSSDPIPIKTNISDMNRRSAIRAILLHNGITLFQQLLYDKVINENIVQKIVEEFIQYDSYALFINTYPREIDNNLAIEQIFELIEKIINIENDYILSLNNLSNDMYKNQIGSPSSYMNGYDLYIVYYNPLKPSEVSPILYNKLTTSFKQSFKEKILHQIAEEENTNV